MLALRGLPLSETTKSVLNHNFYIMPITKEIPPNSTFAVRPKSESSDLEVEANNNNIPTLNAPISTNKAFIFQLTVEDYFKNHFGLIRSHFSSLSLIKFVAFFLGHPVRYKIKDLDAGNFLQLELSQ